MLESIQDGLGMKTKKHMKVKKKIMKMKGK